MLDKKEIEDTFRLMGLIESKERERILSQGIISSDNKEIMQYKTSTDSNTHFI
jgi:hypothetical protein